MIQKIENQELTRAIRTGNFFIVHAAIKAGAKASPGDLTKAISTFHAGIVNAVVAAGAQAAPGDYAYAKSTGNANIVNAVKKPVKKLDHHNEIKINAQILAQAYRTETSFFAKLPPENLIKIASLMGKNRNVIEDDKEGYEIAFKNFSSSSI
ncbi:MAG: hypothetical protein H0U57_07065 [Tatlockia sp.]|nr:hypothetical protein [Tatlockia sp.]